MLHKLMLTIVLAASTLAPLAGIGAAPHYAQERLPNPQGQRYWVQIRYPQWQAQTFYSRVDMDNFIRTQQQNGWEVQIADLPDGSFSVRYRLMNWAGSRLVDSLGAAQVWAANLQGQGYETRIVNYP